MRTSCGGRGLVLLFVRGFASQAAKGQSVVVCGEGDEGTHSTTWPLEKAGFLRGEDMGSSGERREVEALGVRGSESRWDGGEVGGRVATLKDGSVYCQDSSRAGAHDSFPATSSAGVAEALTASLSKTAATGSTSLMS